MPHRPFQPLWGSSRHLVERGALLTFPVALVVAIIFLLLVFPSTKPQDSTSHDAFGDSNIGRRDAIKSAFQFAWNGYYTLAFPHDELKPLSNTPGHSRNDWGATAIDALGTAILMEMPEIVKQILAHVKSIDFNSTSTPISVFESTIRYMGGLLSAYELLTGPFASLNPDSENLLFLVDQAEILGHVLSSAFVQGNALPSGELEPHTFKGNGKNSLAGAGTLVGKI
jgi:mannosyl-oligosaccharide alpha-1,2-mannosidase